MKPLRENQTILNQQINQQNQIRQNFDINSSNQQITNKVESQQKNTNQNNINNNKLNKKEKVSVFVRLRPYQAEEIQSSQNQKDHCIENFDVQNNQITLKKDYERKNFNFDKLFGPKVNQQQIFEQVGQPIIQNVLQGMNGTIFAYGQTGAGKTYTMFGDHQNSQQGIGLVPRAIQQIFYEAQNDQQYDYKIQISAIQIYMEMLQDLLNLENQDIRLRECPQEGVFVSNIQWVDISSLEDSQEVLEKAQKNRVLAFTNLNSNSTRSHVVLMLKIEKRKKHDNIQNIQNFQKFQNLQNEHEDNQQNIKNALNKAYLTSKLYLVDLAGSERVKKSRSQGERLLEAKYINSSLTSLGKCINALASQKNSNNENLSKFVPFRESKLTRLLQDSLGGNCKTALIINIGPFYKHLDETISSLTFGMRAMKVQNLPKINQQKDYYAISLQLQLDLDEKDNEIAQLQIQQAEIQQDLLKIKQQMENQEEKHTVEKNQIIKNSQILIQKLQKQEYQNQEEIKEMQKKQEILTIENKYKQILKQKEKEYKQFLEEVDGTLVDQEEELDQLKDLNEQYIQKLEENNQDIANLIQDREYFQQQFSDIQKKYIEETSQMQKDLSSLENEIEKSEQEKLERENFWENQLSILEQKFLQQEKRHQREIQKLQLQKFSTNISKNNEYNQKSIEISHKILKKFKQHKLKMFLKLKSKSKSANQIQQNFEQTEEKLLKLQKESDKNYQRINEKYDHITSITQKLENLLQNENKIRQTVLNSQNQPNNYIFLNEGQKDFNINQNEFKNELNQTDKIYTNQSRGRSPFSQSRQKQRFQSKSPISKNIQQQILQSNQKMYQSKIMIQKSITDIQDKDALLKQYDDTLKLFRADKKLLIKYSQKQDQQQKILAAVIKIQTIFRKKNFQKQKNLIKKQQNLLIQEKLKIQKNFEDQNLQTGKYLISQTYKKIEDVFKQFNNYFVAPNENKIFSSV